MLVTSIFLLFLQRFLPFRKQISIFQPHLTCRLQNAFNLAQSKNLSFGNEVIHKIIEKNAQLKNCPEGVKIVLEKKKILVNCIFAFIHNIFNPLPDDKILDWSELKQVADDFLKCI